MSVSSFVIQTSPTQRNLNEVFAVTPSQIVAVGDGGTILFYNGQGWAQRSSGTTVDLKCVWAATAPAGATAAFWAVGNGVLLESVDGGARVWTPVPALAQAMASAGITVPPNLRTIWGSSSLDIWTIDCNNGAFWHTTNGGVGWSCPGGTNTLFREWSRMNGGGPSDIFAFGRTLAASFPDNAFYNGTTWNIQTLGHFELDGVVNQFSNQLIGVGYNPSGGANFGPSGGQIWAYEADLNPGFGTRSQHTVPTGAAVLNAVDGVDLTNLYAVGLGMSGGPVILQPSGGLAGALPATAGTSGAWQLATGPSGMPSGAQLNGISVVPGGFAVAVGALGTIMVTPGVTIGVSGAAAIATNTVQVQLSNIPLALTSAGAGDALNPSNWNVQQYLPSGVLSPLTVLAVQLVTPTVFNVIVAERFGPASMLHTVWGSFTDYLGNTASPSGGNFLGVLGDAVSSQNAMAAAQNYVVSDLANPPFPPVGQNTGGGVRVINAAGDFASVSGNALTRKLIVRRLSTSVNGFFHLPGYGLGLDPKSPVRASSLVALSKVVRDQILQEPDVVDVQGLSVELDETNSILTISGTALTTNGQTVPFQTAVTAGSGS